MFEKFVQLIILFSVFGVFEIFYSSETFPSIKSKVRNVIYTVILLFLGDVLLLEYLFFFLSNLKW